jgi:septum site-determining protein MinC
MIEKTTNRIKIKGIQDGLLITTNHQDWHTFQEELLLQITEREQFYQGARIAIEAGELIIHAAEMGQLRDRLSDKGVSLRAVISSSEITRKTAELLGLETTLVKKKTVDVSSKNEKEDNGDGAVLYRRTIRSGVSIISENNVIVLGDVNPGAEIISAQNIMIWGRLRGLAHAGKDDNTAAIICALSMAPTSLRIGTIVSELPVKLKKSRPYMARINHGVIHFEPWDKGEK